MQFQRAVDLRRRVERKSHFLLGPRQTGKSTLIQEQFGGVKTFDLLETETYLALNRAPHKLRESCSRKDRLVVIDEIQRIPALLDEVQLLIEREGLRFLLTGSSARKLRRSGVNLLGGRARSLHFHPLVSQELGEHLDLARALNHGLLPSIYLSDEPEQDLRAYTGTYLREEIAAEGLTRNVPSFARFLEVAALCSGQVLNYTKVANDAQVARATVQTYFEILRDTLLGFDLPVLSETRRRKATATAKFYLFDPGVTRHLRNSGAIQARSPEFGHAFEGFLFHELRSWTDYHAAPELCYWRSLTGYEVDFIVARHTAIEVKATPNADDRDLRGLRALKEEKLLRQYLLICQEPRERRTDDGIRIVPWRQALRELWAGDYGG